MDINYDELTLTQLKEINKKSASAIASFKNRRKMEAISKATVIAKEAGFSSLQEMLGIQPKRKLFERTTPKI